MAGAADRPVSAALLGAGRERVAAPIARHAPDVPVVSVGRTDDEAMSDVVRAAAAPARPGHTALLVRAAAAMDMFTDFAAGGDAVVAAVDALR